MKIDPAFLFPDGFRAHAVCERNAVPHRLVKAPKSPTREEKLAIHCQQVEFFNRAHALKHGEVPVERATIHEVESPRVKTQHGTVGTKTIVELREWSEEYRIRTAVECTSGTLPPPQEGPRESINLSFRGAKKIAEACEYMHLKHDGFKTFVTGTFAPEARERIDSGKTTIQREVSRCMDALQKMYARGWTTDDGERVPGIDGGLPYVWVVEVPKNEQGEDNPHVHMLLGWSVPFKQFKSWAGRIEGIWGNGTFHLEKIKDAACAGAYMAKAAGYLTKASDQNDQGQVRGNRYGISEPARAPDWVTLTESQLHTMGQIIWDIQDHLTVKYGDLYSERKKLNQALANTPKEKKAARQAIGKRLAKVRDQVKKIPVRCNGYNLVIKGVVEATRFFTWVKTPAEESKKYSWPDWLPEMMSGWEWKEGEKVTPKDTQYFARLRRMWRRLSAPPEWIVKAAESLEFWHSTKNDYEQEEALLQEYENDGYRFGYV